MHTITLFGGGPGFGLPEISPFATKTEIQLKMAGLAFTKERAQPSDSPKGQLPFIKDGGALIADSTFIRAHIEKTYGFDFDAGLDARQRAEAWAIERMIENHFNFASGYTRFLLPENFAKGPAHWADGAPEPMRAGLRQGLLDAVTVAFKANGIARHAPEETVELGDRSLNALSALMDDKPYLMGNQPAGVDAFAFASLAGILTPFFDSPLRRRAESYSNLVAYTARMMARYFPDHPWG
jgi:glutathione S-transferase